MFPPVSALISFARISRAFREASMSRTSFSLAPKILGKYSGSSRPRTRFASVIAGGPFFLRVTTDKVIVLEWRRGGMDVPIAGGSWVAAR